MGLPELAERWRRYLLKLQVRDCERAVAHLERDLRSAGYRAGRGHRVLTAVLNFGTRGMLEPLALGVVSLIVWFIKRRSA